MKVKNKKKLIILSMTFLATISTSAILGGVFYSINKQDKNSLKLTILDSSKAKLVDGENLNTNNARDSFVDININKTIPPQPPVTQYQPPVEVVEPTPDPEPIEPEITPPEEEKPIEDEKPEPNEPEPTPPEDENPIVDDTPPTPEPSPQPPKVEIPPNDQSNKPQLNEQPKPTPPPIKPIEQPDPTTQSSSDKDFEGRVLGDNEEYVYIAGVKTIAKVKKPQPRNLDQEDIDKGITNKNPYTNLVVSNIESIEVTEEVRNANIGLGRQLLKGRVWPSFFDEIFDPNNAPDKNPNFDVLKWLDNDYFRSTVERFKQLLDSPNVFNYLTSEGQFKWEEIQAIENRDLKYAHLIRYLDYSKFTKLSPEAEKFLKEGYVLTDNVYVKADGTFSSYSWALPDKNNTVTSRLTKDNLTRRVFDYNSYEKRSSGSIESGGYPGWTLSDVSSQYEEQLGFSKQNDDIKIEKITRDVKEEGRRNEGLILTIDAANSSGYAKTLKLIQDLQAKNIEITSYRIKNMGKNDANQRFIEILAALPNDIPQLELFFSRPNTSALIALENKNIKELSLYNRGTVGQSLLEEWNYNPWSFKNTEWINKTDYNVGFGFERGANITTVITFNTISFDPQDYRPDSSDPYARINDGLRMVYYVRNNEPFFQGAFGPGLNPDHDEGNNSYPTGLDLSRIPQLKSLKGLIFRDSKKSSNRERKLKRLVLYNNTTHFEIDVEELNQAQFKDIMVLDPPPVEKSQIRFSNGTSTVGLKITNNKNIELNSDGAKNLSVLYDLAKEGGLKKEAKVTDVNSPIAERLKQLGIKVIADDSNVVFN